MGTKYTKDYLPSNDLCAKCRLRTLPSNKVVRLSLSDKVAYQPRIAWVLLPQRSSVFFYLVIEVYKIVLPQGTCAENIDPRILLNSKL